jgi:hypothetical protein
MTRMTNTGTPSPDELPTTRQLNRATLLAAGAAAVILVTTVLPAEYGIDPTGIGSVLGLTAMGVTKQTASTGAAPETAAANADLPESTTLPDGSTQLRIVLRPFQGREAKATMKAGQSYTWRWATDGAKVEYEQHGDPENAVSEDDYTSYDKGESAGASGTFRAAFTGRHGWYWKNNSPRPVVITATAKGEFDRFAPLD